MDLPCQTIAVHAAAPAKPAVGEPCNGCGVCCASELCPPARLMFWQKGGPCAALLWEETGRRYLCQLVAEPAARLRWLPRFCQAAAGRLFARAVAVGCGCDCDAQVLPPGRA